MAWLNYHHLLYFWTVATKGSLAEAARILNLTQPAISAQIKTLERSLGVALFSRRGRRLELTEVGRVVARYAEQIFTLGRELQETLAGAAPDHRAPLRIGVVDALPKLLVHRLLGPALDGPGASRLVVTEGKLDRLLADLAIHEVDVVFADAPAPPSVHVRTFSHLVLESGITFFAAPRLAGRLRRGFPGSLQGTPLLAPTANTSLRRTLDAWLAARELTPAIRAEIDDSAVLKVFGEQGLGVFAAPTVVADDVVRRYRVRPVGVADGAREQVYAITVERRISHPGVLAITEAASRGPMGTESGSKRGEMRRVKS